MPKHALPGWILAFSLAASAGAESPGATSNAPVAHRILIVENRAEQPIFRLYVETTNPACWCEDVLGEAVIEPRASTTIDLGEGKSCRYDLVAVMKDETRVSKYNADLCAMRRWVVGPGAESRTSGD
jgi:hypothetical protein